MRSIGVLLPTRNSMALLENHLETMRPWLDLAREIVVIDSESSDGTVDYLRKHLADYPVRFFQHPRGLYQSWNFGIRQISAEYTYISTIGDGITRDGLCHLDEVAGRFDCDVVISPPKFIDENGRPTRCNAWPVHEITRELKLKTPACLEGLTVFALALAFLPFAILGSSASNLYRTRTLQEFPFPTDFGTNGDGAWGLAHALAIRVGITPECMSFFRRHRKSYGAAEYDAPDGDGRMMQEGIRSLEGWLASHPEGVGQALEIGLDPILASKYVVQEWRDCLKRQRQLPLPWIFNPIAWVARWRRNAAQAHCHQMIRRVLARPLGELAARPPVQQAG